MAAILTTMNLLNHFFISFPHPPKKKKKKGKIEEKKILGGGGAMPWLLVSADMMLVEELENSLLRLSVMLLKSVPIVF